MINKLSVALTACLTVLCSANIHTTPVPVTDTPEPIIAAETVPASEPIAELTQNFSVATMKNVKLTHYCICEKCCGKTPAHPAYGITASGRKAEPYVSVAVDPDVIPLGSTVWIEYADGKVIECRADDTGGAINGSRIDLCVSSHSEAWNLGIDNVTVKWKEADEVYYSDDPVSDFLRHDADKQKELEKLPVCCECDEPIQDEYCYEINDELICEKCLKAHYRKHTDDYIGG